LSSDEESASRALHQAAEACGIEIATKPRTGNSATGELAKWKTKHVARVEGRDGLAYAFKCFRSSALATKESSILLHLAGDAACKIQELQRCINGDALTATDLGPMMVTRWIEGASLSYEQIDSEGWAVLGRSLADLHKRLEGFECGAAETLSDQFLALSLGSERARIVRDRKALSSLRVPTKAITLQDARLRLLEEHLAPCVSRWPKSPPQLIHNDYNVHNYIYGENGELAVIDWDRALFAPKEYEVVRCLNHLPLEAPSLASAFILGYRETMSLDEDALEWAIHAAMVAHASKHWPNELALAGAPAAIERLVALEKIVSRLAENGTGLRSFFSGYSTKSH